MSGQQRIEVIERGRVALRQGPLPDDAADKCMGQTRCSLISPGTEWNLFLDPSGELAHRFPGYAAIVTVDSIGSAVTRFAPGDRVLCMQRHADRQRFKQDYAWSIPVDCPDSVAAIARLAAVSTANLLCTAVPAGSRVLVTGLGPIGLCAAALFADHGYEVHATDPQDRCRAHAQALGVDSSSDLTGLPPTFDLHLECSGVDTAVMQALPYLQAGAEIRLVGVPWRASCSASAHTLLQQIFHNYLHLHSGWEWQLPLDNEHVQRGTTHAAMQRALAWVDKRQGDLKPLIREVEPGECQRVYDRLRAGECEEPFVCFRWTD